MKIIDGKLCLHKGNSSNTKTKKRTESFHIVHNFNLHYQENNSHFIQEQTLIREIFKEVLLTTYRKENYSSICLSLHKFHPKQRHEHDIDMILTGSREKGNFVYCFAE